VVEFFVCIFNEIKGLEEKLLCLTAVGLMLHGSECQASSGFLSLHEISQLSETYACLTDQTG
jgi:hypothetical protein